MLTFKWSFTLHWNVLPLPFFFGLPFCVKFEEDDDADVESVSFFNELDDDTELTLPIESVEDTDGLAVDDKSEVEPEADIELLSFAATDADLPSLTPLSEFIVDDELSS
ncbi:unnamed protein product [[Candida] boidinii]|uniref:Unnamed protein product n=1 Tax=Candida boidinii TaxID=5477 RepID=A0ACB5U957_CANBO|nr:unnamed protein product [[Candida] boidinii]